MESTRVSTDLEVTIQRRRIATSVVYFFSFMALGLSTASLGPTIPSLAEHTRTHLGEISFLFTARSLGYLLGSLEGGWLYDRMKKGHLIMAGSLVFMAAMLALVPIIPLIWVLTAVLLVLGASEATLDVGGNTLLVWTHREKVGPFMNGLHFFFGVGSFFSPLLIAQAVLLSGDILWAYWALALLMLPVAVALVFFPSPASPSATVLSPSHRKTRPELVALIALFFFLFCGAESSYGGWIYTYALAMKLSTTTVAATLTSVYWGGLTLGRLVGIPITARVRPAVILLIDLLACLVGLGIVLAFPQSFPAAMAGSVCMGLGMASVFPVTMTFAGRRLAVTARITSAFLVGASAGGMVLPWVIGQYLEQVGPRTFLWIVAADVVVAIVVYGLLNLISPEPGPAGD